MWEPDIFPNALPESVAFYQLILGVKNEEHESLNSDLCLRLAYITKLSFYFRTGKVVNTSYNGKHSNSGKHLNKLEAISTDLTRSLYCPSAPGNRIWAKEVLNEVQLAKPYF